MIKYILSALTALIFLSASAQKVPADKVIAVVGEQIVLMSEMENQLYQMKEQGMKNIDQLRCDVFEEMLFQKLLIHQAAIDSIVISDEQVEVEMDRRLRFFIAQIGSEKALEEYYGKSIGQIKEEFRGQVRDQLVVQQMQATITDNVKVTPGEVRAFFNKIPQDSLPLISEELEVGQILVKPKVSTESKKAALEKITGIRERIVNGEKMATLAVLYSDDPGSARKRGELGFVNRGTFVPEFEAMAFNLQEGEVSLPVETPFGYHILELIERRGEQINVRHILVRPQLGPEDLQIARARIDSVYEKLTSTEDPLSFSEAARIYSDDPATKSSGGLFFNDNSGTTRFESDQLEPRVFFTVDKMKVGEYSEPMLTDLPDGTQGYRILYLKSRSEPHRANLKDDYQRIQEAATEDKKATVAAEWVQKKTEGTYVRVDESYLNCDLSKFMQPKAQK